MQELMTVPRRIWTCWFQGLDTAPPVVRACVSSWLRHNPTWELRCLEAKTVSHYAPVASIIDLERQRLTAASLADIARLLLLQRYGGVWVDATVLCTRPLDDWLPEVARGGFFAFAAPAPDRPLASWLLASDPRHILVSSWRRAVELYWARRKETDDYYWLHHEFARLLAARPDVSDAWRRVSKLSADGPHALQAKGLLPKPAGDAAAAVDWSTPVFKLTHRLSPDCLLPGTLLSYLIQRELAIAAPRPALDTPSADPMLAALDGGACVEGGASAVSIGPIAPNEALPPPAGEAYLPRASRCSSMRGASSA